MVEAESAKSYQEQGNEFYKAELWLKAAACYTKGIKEEPEKVALYRYSFHSCKTRCVVTACVLHEIAAAATGVQPC